MAAFAAAAFMAFSCSNDDSTPDVPLQGKWKLISVTSNRAFDGNGDGTPSTDILTELGSCYTDSYVEFGNINTIKTVTSTIPSEGTNCVTATDEGTYKFTPYNVQTTFVHDGIKTHTNYAKTGNLITLSVPALREIEVTVDGEIRTVAVDAKMVFQKQ